MKTNPRQRDIMKGWKRACKSHVKAQIGDLEEVILPVNRKVDGPAILTNAMLEVC